MNIDTILKALDELQNIVWVIEEGPAHVKLTEAVTRLVALKDTIATIISSNATSEVEKWRDFYNLQAQRMMIERDAALRELAKHKVTDASVDEAVAKTLQYLNAELDKKDAWPDAVRRVVKCQELLARYIVHDSGISDHEVINDLIGVLDAPLVVGFKAHDDTIRRGCATFDEIKEYLLGESVKYKSEYIQAAIVMLRIMFEERAAIMGGEAGK